MSDLTRTQASQPVQITDDASQVTVLSTGPAGTEAGLVVRNIPYGTQTVNITNAAAQLLTVAPLGTETAVVTRNIPSGIQPVSGTVTNVPSGTQAIAGDAASGGSSVGNPLGAGGRAALTLPTAVGDTFRVAQMLDKFGRIVTMSTAPRDLQGCTFIQATTTTPVTIAAGVASTFVDITSLMLNNTTTVAMTVTIKDGTTQTMFFNLTAAYPTICLNFDPPMVSGTLGNAWTAGLGAAGTCSILCTWVKNAK